MSRPKRRPKRPPSPAPKPELPEIVTALIAHRKSLGLSQSKFAARLEISLATLRNWEQGRTAPDATVSGFIRQYLKTS